jgi:hypothetical protein
VPDDHGARMSGKVRGIALSGRAGERLEAIFAARERLCTACGFAYSREPLCPCKCGEMRP